MSKHMTHCAICKIELRQAGEKFFVIHDEQGKQMLFRDWYAFCSTHKPNLEWSKR